MLRQQRLVPRHHDFTRLDRADDELPRLLDAAHEFDHDLHIWIVHHILPARGEDLRGRLHLARLLRVAHGDAPHDELEPEALREQVAILSEVFENPCAHSAESGEADADLFHKRARTIGSRARCGKRVLRWRESLLGNLEGLPAMCAACAV